MHVQEWGLCDKWGVGGRGERLDAWDHWGALAMGRVGES